MFSDMEMGTRIFLLAIVALIVFYGMKKPGGKGGKGGSSGGSSGGGTGSAE